MWILLEDGWRDESSEGPYIDTLQTKYDWKNNIVWSVVRGINETMFRVKKKHDEFTEEFSSLDSAKKFVDQKMRGDK